MSYKDLEAEALKLDQNDRAHLASLLIRSLDDQADEISEEQWNKLWGAEALRRNTELDADLTLEIPGEEVFRRMRSKYR